MTETTDRVKHVDRMVFDAAKVEYLVFLVSEFAERLRLPEAKAYRYLRQTGAFSLCDRHYGVMHTLPLEDNLRTIQDYCRRKEVVP